MKTVSKTVKVSPNVMAKAMAEAKVKAGIKAKNLSKKVEVKAETPKPKPTTKTPKSKPFKQELHLKEGVTGKMLMNGQRATNNKHKGNIYSFKFNLKQAIEQDTKFISLMNIDVKDLTHKNLMKYVSDAEKLRAEKRKAKTGQGMKFSVWGVQGLIKRYAKDLNKKQA